MTDVEIKENPEMSAAKKTYYSAPYTEFVRTERNYRGNVERPELIDLIKSDLGVRDPIFVLPGKRADGKREIWEGNSRHRSLEILANDKEYIEKGGSLELSYRIIPPEVADNPRELKKFMLSANATDKRISPQEQWNAFKDLIDDFEKDFTDAKDPRNEAAKAVASFLGKSAQWVQKLRRVYEKEPNAKVLELLEEGTIPSVEYADSLRVNAKKAQLPVEQFIEEVLDHARAAGKSKVSDTYIDQAYKALTVDVDQLIEEVDQEQNSDEIIEDTEEEVVNDVNALETAEEELKHFAEFIQSLKDEDWVKLGDTSVIDAAKKVSKLQKKLTKYLTEPKTETTETVEE